ncbi:MAG: SDR family oxidoreductase [Candidatus Hodarchaeota archaeon]
MNLGLQKKVALVAASSKGLGKAVAIGLATEGAHVCICARNKEELEKTKNEIQQYGTEVLAFTADLTQYNQVKNLVGKTLDYFGRVDILVTNCGGPPPGSFLDFSIENWRHAIDLNLMSTIYLCKEILPIMIKQNSGRIIMITSVSVKQPIPGLILSNVVRAGVTGLAKSLSNEFGKRNILINTVCPGYTSTERVKQLAETISRDRRVEKEKIIQEWANQNAVERLAKPEEFANVVVFLASDKASHLTGTSIQVDGGYVKSLL